MQRMSSRVGTSTRLSARFAKGTPSPVWRCLRICEQLLQMWLKHVRSTREKNRKRERERGRERERERERGRERERERVCERGRQTDRQKPCLPNTLCHI